MKKSSKALKLSLAAVAALAVSMATVACDGAEEEQQPQVTTYTVTYALNGGEGTAPEQTAVEAGDTFTVASADGITKTGYTFSGWNDGAADYAAGSVYTMPEHDVTLTAVWTENGGDGNDDPITYTVTYALNGGEGTAPEQTAVEAGDTFTVASADGITNTGYTFSGWNDGVADYAAGSVYTMPEHDVTLTAVWTENGGDEDDPITYTVTYALNGGEGVAPEQTAVEAGDTFTVASGDGITKTGYTFSGWNDGAADYAAGSAYTMPEHDVTLTAVWTENGGDDTPDPVTPTVVFDGNGGTGSAPTAVITPVGAYYKVTLPTCTYTAPTGKKFLAWQYDGAQYDEGDNTITLSAGDYITIKALWTNDSTVADEEIDGTAYLGSLTLKESINSNYGNFVEYVKFTVSEDMSAATFYYYEKKSLNEYVDNAVLKHRTISFDTYESSDIIDHDGEVKFIRLGNNIKHTMLFSTDMSQFKLCDVTGNDYFIGDTCGGSMLFVKGVEGDGYVDFTVKDMLDLDGKDFASDARFTCGGAEFVGIRFASNSIGAVLKTIYISNGAEKVLETSIAFVGTAENGYLWTFHSNSYDITLGKKADGNIYIAAFRYKQDNYANLPVKLTAREETA